MIDIGITIRIKFYIVKNVNLFLHFIKMRMKKSNYYYISNSDQIIEAWLFNNNIVNIN